MILPGWPTAWENGWLFGYVLLHREWPSATNYFVNSWPLQEYEEQGKRETAKELSKLQEYCREHEEVLEDVKDTSRWVVPRDVLRGTSDKILSTRVHHVLYSEVPL